MRSGYPPLVRTLLGLCEGYLAQPGGVRDMAGACLGRLLVRPDCVRAQTDFVAWARHEGLCSTGPEAAFLVPGAAPGCSRHHGCGAGDTSVGFSTNPMGSAASFVLSAETPLAQC